MKAKYILFDILNTEKNMKINMACALNEASCDEVYDLYYKTGHIMAGLLYCFI